MASTVRPARPADAPRLAELRWEFRAGRARAAETRDAFLRRTTAWMRDRLATERWRCWVAESDGVVVGHVWLQLIEKIPNPVQEHECHAYVTNLYVREAARGGVGAALLQAALEWCQTRNVDDVLLWPTERSRSLYERHGFAVRRDIMARRLGPRPDTP